VIKKIGPQTCSLQKYITLVCHNWSRDVTCHNWSSLVIVVFNASRRLHTDCTHCISSHHPMLPLPQRRQWLSPQFAPLDDDLANLGQQATQLRYEWRGFAGQLSGFANLTRDLTRVAASFSAFPLSPAESFNYLRSLLPAFDKNRGFGRLARS